MAHTEERHQEYFANSLMISARLTPKFAGFIFIFSGYLTVFDIVDLSGKPRKLERAGEIQTT